MGARLGDQTLSNVTTRLAGVNREALCVSLVFLQGSRVPRCTFIRDACTFLLRESCKNVQSPVAIVPLGGVAVSAYVLIQRLRRRRAASARTDEHHASPEEGGAVQQALEKSAPN